jgi:hypothetical protein
VGARKGVLQSAVSRLKKAEGGYWPRAMIERELEEWRRRDKAGKLRELCQVAIYVLEKKLQKRKA